MAPFLTNTIGGSLISFALIATSSPPTNGIDDLTTTTRKQSRQREKFLFEETFTSSLTPNESRDYLLCKTNWLDIVPEFENGTVNENEEKVTGDPGSWSMTAENGSHILCTNTISSDTSFDDNDDNNDEDGCFLKYNVVVTSTDNVQFTIDIEYDIKEGSVTRIIHGFDTIGLKSKIFKPLIKSPLIELMQEENRRLTKVMNPDNPSNGSIIHSSITKK